MNMYGSGCERADDIRRLTTNEYTGFPGSARVYVLLLLLVN